MMVEHEVEEKISRLKVKAGMSVRPALVYAGQLARGVRARGAFDALVSIEDMLNA